MAASAIERSNTKTTGDLLRGNQMPMWIYDRETLRFVEVSEGALRQYGFSRDEFMRMTPRQLLAPRSTPPQNIHRSGDTGRTAIHQRRDGRTFPVRIHSNALIYNGRLSRLVVAIGPTIAADAPPVLPEISRLMFTMGLSDRRMLEDRAEEAFLQADRNGRRVAVVCLDIDHFDEVPERYGDDASRLCLEQVAHWLHHRIRGMDTVARTGVHGFTVVLAELDNHFDLYRVAEALLKIFAEPVMYKENPIILSASIGIAVYPDDARGLEQLEHAADTAMQQARASGGHRIAMFSLESRERTELAAYMREALKTRSFTLHYQPQYSPAGVVCKFEALLRLPAREKGLISPDLFVPIAEETGMIQELGMWVIEEASRQSCDWHRRFGSVLPIAVNVSPLQLKSERFAERALATIRSCGANTTCIEFEITERAVLNFNDALEPMQRLAEAGIVFAVDDFGTGYSSLQHLHRLPISVLKIDRYFINRLGVQRDADAIVEAIISMAHALGMKVVAEGVETIEQRNASTSMGCDVIQGFLHSPAIQAEKIPLLMNWSEAEPEI